MARKLHVPQQDGEIVLTYAGDPDDVRTFKVDDHIVSPRNEQERAELLLHIDGARNATAKEVPPGAPKPNAGSPSGDKK